MSVNGNSTSKRAVDTSATCLTESVAEGMFVT
jgi:hypothetical protein